MNQRAPVILTSQQNEISLKNRKYLAQKGIDFGLLSITQTGLKKFIIDAVGSLRTYLKENEYHDYDTQSQGPLHKVLNPCYLVISDNEAPIQNVSLYRPNTKKGDPRIWISNLSKYAKAGDNIVLIVKKNDLYIFNISQLDLSKNLILQNIIQHSNSIANELLDLFKKLKSLGPLQSVMPTNSPTAIGRTIETALGITANSSKNPDYKGIEIKSSRSTKKNRRYTIFCKVPDWSISQLKSTDEILNHFGYTRKSHKNRILNCTISAKKHNSQGLIFKVDLENDFLCSEHITKGDVTKWNGQDLRNSLMQKHTETFWIVADSKTIKGIEFFDIKSITYTKKPLQFQFLNLVNEGVITMDHGIKRINDIGNGTDRGPLFKISAKNLSMLFPIQQIFHL